MKKKGDAFKQHKHREFHRNYSPMNHCSTYEQNYLEGWFKT